MNPADHQEPPEAPPQERADTATERTETQDGAVQPIHSPNVEPQPAELAQEQEAPEPPPPYDGPTDKETVIAAVIAGRCTTREAADLFSTTPATVRVWTGRARARAARPPKPPKIATKAPPLEVLRPVMARPAADQDEPQTFEDEGEIRATLAATLADVEAEIASLQGLQINPPQQPETAPITAEEAERNSQEGGATAPTATVSTDHASSQTQILHAGTANLQNPSLPRSRKVTKRLEQDEGYFERDELDTLDNLHRIIVKNAKRAESGRDCQGWTTALATVLDLRRRAAGRSSTLVKEQTGKALERRQAIVFIGAGQQPTAPSIAKLQRPAPIVDVQASMSGPPSLKAAMQAAPDYVRAL